MKNFSAIVIAVLLIGCDTLTFKAVPPQVSQTAIAEDGLDRVVVMQTFERNQTAEKDPSHIFGASRNFEHQIFVENQDGSNRRAITAKRPYKDVEGTLHYMKAAGYVLLGSQVYRNKQYITRYDKINLSNGQEMTIRYQSEIPQPDLCKDAVSQSFIVENILPSPDGQWLAHFYSPACFKAVVEFLAANTLQVLDKQLIDIKGIHEAKWTAQKELLMYSIMPDIPTAWKLQPGSVPLSTAIQ